MRQVTWIILGIVLLAGEAPAALYESANGPFVTLIEAGRSQAQIVVSDKPAFLEEFAASELRTYLRKISGVNVPIVKETERDGRLYGFFLGKTERSEASGVVPDERTMGLDGFALRSVPEGLVVLGRTDLGTLFGVYELLERYFDVRWFMPGDLGECVPRREAVRMGQVDLTHKPSFRVRWIGNGEWPLRQRMNVGVTVGNQSVGIKWRWNFHSFNKLMSPEQYFSGHPEYFALVNGKRDVTDSKTHGNQLCTSNSAVIAEIAKNLTAVLDAEPDIEVIALSPNDGGGFCECEACESLDEPDHDWFGRYSRRLMTFNNEVAKRVKEKHPDVFIKVGAYAMYARPPLEESHRPEDNLIVQLCHLYFCHNHSLDGDACRAGETYRPNDRFLPNREFRRILDQWLELSPRVFIYEYYSIGGMARANLPWPLVHTIRTDIPYYRDRGVEGFYSQLSDSLWHRLGLNYYLAAKLCWNADLNADALLDDYFANFYGPAAEPMKDYFLAMEQAMQAWNGCVSYGLQGVTGLRDIGPKVFTPSVLRRMRVDLEEAENRTNGCEVLSARIAMARQMFEETIEALPEKHPARAK